MLILSMSAVGMFLGALVIYFLAGFVYLAIYPGGVTNGYECARGMAVSYLSLFGGAFLGCSGGAVLGAKIVFKQNDINSSPGNQEFPETQVIAAQACCNDPTQPHVSID
jgi:hypothetical protein